MKAFFLFILLICAAVDGYAAVQSESKKVSNQIYPLDYLKDILPYIDRDTWVLFDIDDVIVAPHATWLWERDFLAELAKRAQDDAERKCLIACVEQHRFPMQYQLVDKTFAQVFKEIKARAACVGALTGRDEFDDNLRAFLQTHDIHFTMQVAHDEGIIFCKSMDKGSALFDTLQTLPKKIVFIDDSKKNCETVFNACRAAGVACTIFHYEQAKKVFDLDVARLQLHYLKKSALLLSDDEAKERMRSMLHPRKLINGLHAASIDALAISQEATLLQVHRPWLEEVIEYVTSNMHASKVAYPRELDHPIYSFTRKDAKDFLAPLCQNIGGISLSDEMITRLFFETPQIYKENHKFSSIDLFRKENVKNELYKAAQMAYEQVKGNVVFILGQTPAYLGQMMKAICTLENDEQTKIIHVPFSGRPNFVRKPRSKSIWCTDYLNILTEERESLFRSLLEARGFSPTLMQDYPRNIFVIDNSTGPSIACFLALLKNWFLDANVALGQAIYLCMADERDLTIKNEAGQWVPVAIDLSLDDTFSFDVPIQFLGMRDEIVVMFDKILDNLRIVPSFNSIHWQKEYVSQAFGSYPTPEARALLDEYEQYVCQNRFPNSCKCESPYLRMHELTVGNMGSGSSLQSNQCQSEAFSGSIVCGMPLKVLTKAKKVT